MNHKATIWEDGIRDMFGVFNLCQHFEISYSRNANKHITTCVYIAINDHYRQVNLEMQVTKVKYVHV